MSKKQEILIAAIAILMAHALFFAGFLAGGGKLNIGFGRQTVTQTDTQSDTDEKKETMPREDPYVKPGAENNGSYREMLSDYAVPIYDALYQHLYVEKRNDDLVIDNIPDRLDNEYLVCETIKFAYKAFVEDCPEVFWTSDLVCTGYAKSLKALCGRFDIPCVCIYGVCLGEGSHAWNYVQMEDGKWYGVDVTFDDDDGAPSRDIFLLGKNTVWVPENAIVRKEYAKGSFGITHTLESGGIGITGVAIMKYPQLSDEKYLQAN